MNDVNNFQRKNFAILKVTLPPRPIQSGVEIFSVCTIFGACPVIYYVLWRLKFNLELVVLKVYNISNRY